MGISTTEKLDFSEIENEQLQFKTGNMNNEIIKNLLLMTPHFFRVKQEGREAAFKLQKLDLTIDIIFRVLRKC